MMLGSGKSWGPAAAPGGWAVSRRASSRVSSLVADRRPAQKWSKLTTMAVRIKLTLAKTLTIRRVID